MSRRLRSAAALVCAAVALDCADIPTGPPVGVPDLTPTVSLTDTLRIAFSDSTRARLRVAGGTRQRLFVRVMDGAADDSLEAVVYLTGSSISFGSVIALGSTADPRLHRIWMPSLPSTQDVDLHLRWIRRTGDAEAVLTLARADTRAEHAPDTLHIGDTVREFNDGYDDLDRFVIVGTAGQRFSVFVTHEATSAPVKLRAKLLTMADAVLHDRTGPLASSSDTALSAAHTFAPSAPAVRLAVNVEGMLLGTPAMQTYFDGRFEIRVVPIDTLPEAGSNVVTAGDTISGRIDGFGDLDRFVAPLDIGDEFRLIMSLDSASTTPIYLSVRGAGPDFTILATPDDSTLDLARTTFVRRAGPAPVVIDVFGHTATGSDGQSHPYRMVLERRFGDPESALNVLTVNDSVYTEGLSSCADADTYTFWVAPGTIVSPAAMVDSTADCEVQLRIVGPDGETIEARPVPKSSDIDAGRWPSLVLEEAGAYELRVEGLENTGVPLGRATNMSVAVDLFGAFRGPEIVDTVLMLGDSATTETFNRCGDQDWYRITGAPGEWFTVDAGISTGTSCQLYVQHSWEARLFSSAQSRDSTRLGPYLMPEQGYIDVVVYSTPTGSVADRGKAYTLHPSIINRAPETATSALTLGATVFESIERCGDRDHFTFTPVAARSYTMKLTPSRASQCPASLSAWQDGEPLPVFVPEAGTFAFSAQNAGEIRIEVNTDIFGVPADRNLPFTLVVDDLRNEIVPASLVPGDTSGVESIGDEGDKDHFTAAVTSGVAYVFATLGPVDASETTPFGGGSFGGYHPRGRYSRFFANYTGQYRMTVGHGYADAPPYGYRVMAHLLNEAPEVVDSALAVGDTTDAEPIDYPGDLDRFFAAIPANTVIRVHHFVDSTYLGDPLIETFGAARLGIARGASSGLVITEAPSTLEIVAFNNIAHPDTTQLPTYRVALVAYPSANESAPATLAPGATVTTETLANAKDVDTFSLTLVGGTVYYVHLVANATCETRVGAYGMSGAHLGTESANDGEDPVIAFTASQSGTYRFRIFAADTESAACAAFGYQLRVSTVYDF